MDKYLLVIVVLLAATLFYFLVKRLQKGIARKLVDIKRPIYDLLNSDVSSAFLVIERKNSDQFLQLRLTENDSKKEAEIAFPRVDWTKNFYERLITYCQSRGLVVDRKIEIPNNVEFAYVKVGSDARVIYDIVVDIWHSIFDITDEAIFYTLLEYGERK